ncbi:MAG: hypothetical protein ACXVZP_09450 [Gaiellaceae bacterium]
MSDSVESPTLRLIRELLDSAPRVPLTNQARIDPGPLLDLLDRLRPELEGAEPQLDALRRLVETAPQVPLAGELRIDRLRFRRLLESAQRASLAGRLASDEPVGWRRLFHGR